MKTIIIITVLLLNGPTLGAAGDVLEFVFTTEDNTDPFYLVNMSDPWPGAKEIIWTGPSSKKLVIKTRDRNIKLYDLLIKLREFVRDNDEQAWPNYNFQGGLVYTPPPSIAQQVEQKIKDAKYKLEKMNLETALRKDIDAIISVME